MACAGLIRTAHAIGIQLAGPDTLNPDVPHITCAIARRIKLNRPGWDCVRGLIKQLQPNPAGVTAEQGEVDASFMFVCSQWQRNAFPDLSVLRDLCRIIIQRSFLLAYATI